MAAQNQPAAEDILALRRLVDDYGIAVDTRDGSAFADVFTDDAVLAIYEPHDTDNEVMAYTGRAELETVPELVSTWQSTMHLMANHTVDLDGDTGTGMVYSVSLHFRAPREGGKGEDTFMVMRYRDRYVRTAGGWRIARRDVLRQWTESHEAEQASLADNIDS